MLQKIKKNPLKRITNTICNLIKAGNERDNKKLLERNPFTPRIYGAPKIHKYSIPLRPIVNTIVDPPIIHLAKKLKPLVGRIDSFVKDSKHFINEIKNIKLDQNDILVSFDVTSLYTNIPINEAMEVVRKIIDLDTCKLIETCLKSIFFSFMGDIYEQTCGVSMGSPLSPIIANLFMEYFETRALNSTPLKPKWWKIFVDDTYVICPHGRDKLVIFKKHLNILSNLIKLTMEIDINVILPFLDILLSRNANGSLSHQVYRKKTHTEKYLHATSHHHPTQELSVLNTLATRAMRISDKEHLELEKAHLYF